MLSQELLDSIKQKFPDIEVEVTPVKMPIMRVDKDQLVEVTNHLKKDKSLDFDYLSCLSGLDYLDNFELVYQLYSYSKGHHLVLKTAVPRENPEVQSVTSIWATADWFEREVYDLYGVIFQGHPNLKRLLLADDFPGHPMRKEFPCESMEDYLLEDKRIIEDGRIIK